MYVLEAVGRNYLGKGDQWEGGQDRIMEGGCSQCVCYNCMNMFGEILPFV